MQNNVIFKESVICNKEKIVNTVKEVLEKHSLDASYYLTPRVINRIMSTYENKANFIKKYYIIGEMDTFKVAAVLMIAVKKSLDIEDENELCQIALDVAYSFIEKPYYNGGPDYDEPYALEEIDLKECFKGHEELFEQSNVNLLEALLLVEGEPFNYFNNLDLIYRLALLLKHNDTNNVKEQIVEEKVEKVEESEMTSKQKLIKSLFSRFRKKGA